MPLCTTIGASSITAMNRRSTYAPQIWYYNGLPAQGVAYNLQGDNVFYNYNNGINIGRYTGPYYNVDGDNLWRRIINGDAMIVQWPYTQQHVYVNGYFDLDGQGNKWYYNGAVANGYILDLQQYSITVPSFNEIYNPTGVLSDWHFFANGVDAGKINGEHNVDGQGNLWYVDGVLANNMTSQFALKITPDDLWHKFANGVDMGILNLNVSINDINSAALEQDIYGNVIMGGTFENPLLVFDGIPYTGKYYIWNTYASRHFRSNVLGVPLMQLSLGYYSSSAYEFVNGSAVAALTGEHTVPNLSSSGEQPSLYLFRDGGMMYNHLRYQENEFYYYISEIFEPIGFKITGTTVIDAFFPSYENMLLPITDIPSALEKPYLIIDGQMTSAGCQEVVNLWGNSSTMYFCLGNYGEVTGTASSASCSDCQPWT